MYKIWSQSLSEPSFQFYGPWLDSTFSGQSGTQLRPSQSCLAAPGRQHTRCRRVQSPAQCHSPATETEKVFSLQTSWQSCKALRSSLTHMCPGSTSQLSVLASILLSLLGEGSPPGRQTRPGALASNQPAVFHHVRVCATDELYQSIHCENLH